MLESVAVAVRIPPDMKAFLAEEARQRTLVTGVEITMSDIVREVISAHIEARSQGLIDGNEIMRQAHELAIGLARQALNQALSSLPATHEEALARLNQDG